MRVNLCVIVIVKENQDRDPAGSLDLGIISRIVNCLQILPVDKYWKLNYY